MNTLTLPPLKRTLLLAFDPDSPRRSQRTPPLLVFTTDEPFWRGLLAAALRKALKLVRREDTNDTARSLRLFRPGAVLLDLDPPPAWDAADSLLHASNAPPLLLLTSRGDQIDFKTAIEAGSLIDKRADPATVLALADRALSAPEPTRHEQSGIQQLVIRWLKPCGWLRHGAPLRRFWGINE
jgi:DNA-binding response OmpR family regulator